MTNDTKVKIAFADMVLQMDNETFGAAYFVHGVQKDEYGVVFLKGKNNKIIGKSQFGFMKLENYEDYLPPYSGEGVEQEMEEFGVLLGVEPNLPPQQLIDKAFQKFESDDSVDFFKGFDFKALINSKILNHAKYGGTVTKTQVRIPNSGIVVNNYEYLLNLFNKHFQMKEQMSIGDI